MLWTGERRVRWTGRIGARGRIVLVIGVSMALLSAGVAGAAVYTGSSGGDREPGVRSGVDSAQGGQQVVGAVETVNRSLGYLDAPHQTELHYPGASYVKVHFGRLRMLPGDYVTVADPKGTEVYQYAATPLGQLGAATPLGQLGAATPLGQLTESATGGRWAMSVSGDTAVVTLHSHGVRSELTQLGVGVDKVARGYTDAEWAAKRKAAQEAKPRRGADRAPRSGRDESVCGGDEKKDAVCYKSSDPVAYTRSKAVARLLINGNELCTGWRIGPGNRMITNHHCFTTSDEAYNTEVWFDYQCATCGGFDVFRPTKVWGDRVLDTDPTLDYTLFSLEDFAEVQKFGYLDLDLRRPTTGRELYIPQHPAGNPAQIAMGSDQDRAGNCAVADPIYDGYATGTDMSYYCDTEGGSSGSPVIARGSDKVIALHHWGGCPNSGVRIDLIYQEIKSLL
jgi:lysyl endopeptidase